MACSLHVNLGLGDSNTSSAPEGLPEFLWPPGWTPEPPVLSCLLITFSVIQDDQGSLVKSAELQLIRRDAHFPILG